MHPTLIEMIEHYAAADQRLSANAAHHSRELRDAGLFTAAKVCADISARYADSARYWVERAHGGES